MSTFSLVQHYITSAMLILMPLAGMMLIFYSAYSLWRDLSGADRKKLRERLRDDQVRRHAKKLEQSIQKQATESDAAYLQLINQISLTRKLERWIEQSDLNLVATKTMIHIALAAIAVFSAALILQLSIWTTLILGGLAFGMPFWIIRFLARRRMKALVNQLPDVFELISQALRAGHSLASGIQLIGKQLPDPAGAEFARIFHEQNLGIKIEEALTNFADRTDQLDIRFFVTAVLIQRQTGGDLAEILDKISEVIRDRIKILGQVQALTAEGRMSGWVLSVMPFFVFFLAWMMNPEYAGVLLYEKQGQILLGVAIFFQIIGMLMIKKIVNIKI